MSKRRRESFCDDKVRHETRRAAQSVLNATLGGRIELIAPYPCKFCTGRHVGHSPVDKSRNLEPKCACAHHAITHDTFPGLGCRECDCLQHREWVYRAALAGANARAQRALSAKRDNERILRMIFAKMPALGKRFLKRYLRQKLSSLRHGAGPAT